MDNVKRVFKDYLKATATGDKKLLNTYLADNTSIHYSTTGAARGREHIYDCVRPLRDDFSLNIHTITNTMEVSGSGYTCLYAVVHHLTGYDNEMGFFPFLYGGKYEFIYDDRKKEILSVNYDLEYEYGNTLFCRNKWQRFTELYGNRIIDNQHLFHTPLNQDINGVIYRLFWAMDTCDEELFKTYSTEDILVERAGTVNDVYYLNGHVGVHDFLSKDKKYYEQNQYSIVIATPVYVSQTQIRVSVRHLSPGKPGNKHLSSLTKYIHFFNEEIKLDLVFLDDRWKINRMQIHRKEMPFVYGQDIVEL